MAVSYGQILVNAQAPDIYHPLVIQAGIGFVPASKAVRGCRSLVEI